MKRIAEALLSVAGLCSCSATASMPGEESEGSSTGPDVVPDLPAVCGDGIVAPSEDCDDANDVDGDGCSAECRKSGTARWSVAWDGGSGEDDTALGVSTSADGSLVVVGRAMTDGRQQGFVTRLTAEGTIDWTYIDEESTETALHDVVAFADGSSVSVGRTSDGLSLVISLDSAGAVRWRSVGERSDIAPLTYDPADDISAAIIADGAVLTCATVMDAAGSTDVWCGAFRDGGTLAREVLLGQAESNDWLEDLAAAPTGTCLVGIRDDTNRTVRILHLDSDLAIDWEHQVPAIESDDGYPYVGEIGADQAALAVHSVLPPFRGSGICSPSVRLTRTTATESVSLPHVDGWPELEIAPGDVLLDPELGLHPSGSVLVGLSLDTCDTSDADGLLPAIVARFTPTGELEWEHRTLGTSNVRAGVRALAIDAHGDIVAVGGEFVAFEGSNVWVTRLVQ